MNVKKPLKASILPAVAVVIALANLCFGSTARIHFANATVQQVQPVPGGLDITAEAEGAVATFRCYANRTNFQICQALHPGMEVDLHGLPAPPDADEPAVADLLMILVTFEERGPGGGGGDQDGGR